MPPKVKEAVPKRSQLESATCVWPALLAMIGKICFFQASGNIVCFSFRDFLLMWSSVLIWGTLVPQECFYTVYGWSTTKRNFTTLGAWNFVYRTATFGWVPQCSSPFPPPWHWHTIHLGVGKAFISSSMAILQQVIPGSNIDDRFKQITVDYKEFCRDRHLVRFLTKLDKRTFNVGGPLEEPTGGWNKASVTSTLAEFLEYMTIRYADGLKALNDERVPYIVTCLHSCF